MHWPPATGFAKKWSPPPKDNHGLFNSLTLDLKMLVVAIAGLRAAGAVQRQPENREALVLVFAVLAAVGVYRFTQVEVEAPSRAQRRALPAAGHAGAQAQTAGFHLGPPSRRRPSRADAPESAPLEASWMKRKELAHAKRKAGLLLAAAAASSRSRCSCHNRGCTPSARSRRRPWWAGWPTGSR